MEDKVKTRIKELCPDVMNPIVVTNTHEFEIAGNPITLAVVLRAIKIVCFQYALDWSTYEKAIVATVAKWSEHDNYDAQSQETKDFIGSLLNV